MGEKFKDRTYKKREKDFISIKIKNRCQRHKKLSQSIYRRSLYYAMQIKILNKIKKLTDLPFWVCVPVRHRHYFDP